MRRLNESAEAYQRSTLAGIFSDVTIRGGPIDTGSGRLAYGFEALTTENPRTKRVQIQLLGAGDAAALQRVAAGVFDEPVDPRWTASFLPTHATT